MIRVVLDTNVIVAAMRSRRGASFQLLKALGREEPAFSPCLSVPLVLEYESALKRIKALRQKDVDALLNYLCSVGDRREIYFLWRPFLRDPSDEMVLEVAMEAEVDGIITYNLKDFRGVEEKFGIPVVPPAVLLMKLQEVDQ